VQRFFSTFPGSWPGAGLLLLRVVAGGAAGMQGAVYLSEFGGASAAALAAGVLTTAGGVLLVVGFLTPSAGVLAGLGTLFISASMGPVSPPPSLDTVTASFVLADAAALVLLGPGAISMDARLFGRREILIPHDRS
jgi:uncharacterized membrane protein YphA (DoxX/SURF4 family)